MKASLIIPTYNRENALVNTIENCLSQDFKDLEIVVIDQTKQHQTDTTKYIESIKKRIIYITEDIAGLTRARNIGARNASGDILIFIDDDVVLDTDFVSQHIKNYTLNNADAVQGRIIEDDSEPKNKPQWVDNKIRFSGSNNCISHGKTNTLTGCNFSVKKTAYLDVGGFDERYTKSSNNEDSDFGLRLFKNNFNIVFSPEAKVKHLRITSGGVDTGIESQKLSLSYYYCELLFARKHFSYPVVLYYKARLMWRGIKAIIKLVKYADKKALTALDNQLSSK